MDEKPFRLLGEHDKNEVGATNLSDLAFQRLLSFLQVLLVLLSLLRLWLVGVGQGCIMNLIGLGTQRWHGIKKSYRIKYVIPVCRHVYFICRSFGTNLLIC